jgi:hypothetical protein
LVLIDLSLKKWNNIWLSKMVILTSTLS